MGSRLRKGQLKLIDVFVQLVKGEIVSCYPVNDFDEELRRNIPNIPKFAFPFCGNFESSTIDHFTFVLTDIDGKFKFGFCRMSASSQGCLCIVSSYPWFEIFYRILNYLAEILNSADNNVLNSVLSSLCDINPSIPLTGFQSVQVQGFKELSFEYPTGDKLPSIPESRNLTEYYSAIDGYNMLIIFASLMFERRIIITSRKLSRLTACVYGATSLLYPLNWQHIFIPLLPSHLLDYCSAPMPYLIGVHSSVFDSMAKMAEIGDAVIVNADTNKIEHCQNDLASLPTHVVAALKKDLNLHKKNKTVASHCTLTGDSLSKAFLKAMVALIGGYQTAILNDNGKFVFDEDIFFFSHSENMRIFLTKILQSQAFERFIDERLMLLNSQKSIDDAFEMAVEQSESKRKMSKTNHKHKINHVKADKLLHDITKKVKSTSVKTFNSVKRKLDLMKNDVNDGVPGMMMTVNREKVSSERIESKISTLPNISQSVDNRIFRVSSNHSSFLQHQEESFLSSLSSRMRSSSSDDTEVYEIYSRQSTDKLLSDWEMKDIFKKFSYDDLSVSGNNKRQLNDNATLSSSSASSIHNHMTVSNIHDVEIIHEKLEENEKTRDIIENVHLRELSDVHLKSIKDDDDEDSSSNNSESYDLLNHDGDSVFMNNHEISDVVAIGSSSWEQKPIRQIVRGSKFVRSADQTTRKKIISVQELPSVKEIIEKYEASCKTTEESLPLTTSFESSSSSSYIHHHAAANKDKTGSSSFVARQAARYTSMDHKQRSSLIRKHAIRLTASRSKKPGEMEDDGGEESEQQVVTTFIDRQGTNLANGTTAVESEILENKSSDKVSFGVEENNVSVSSSVRRRPQNVSRTGNHSNRNAYMRDTSGVHSNRNAYVRDTSPFKDDDSLDNFDMKRFEDDLTSTDRTEHRENDSFPADHGISDFSKLSFVERQDKENSEERDEMSFENHYQNNFSSHSLSVVTHFDSSFEVLSSIAETQTNADLRNQKESNNPVINLSRLRRNVYGPIPFKKSS